MEDCLVGEGGGPGEVVGAFVHAVGWGEHLSIWEMTSEGARRRILGVAVSRGMSPELAGRLLEGVATELEMGVFLGDLIAGLRKDLGEIDPDEPIMQVDSADSAGKNGACVVLKTRLIAETLGEALPVAVVNLSRENQLWLIDEIQPIRSGMEKIPGPEVRPPIFDPITNGHVELPLNMERVFEESSPIQIRSTRDKTVRNGRPVPSELNEFCSPTGVGAGLELVMWPSNPREVRHLRFAVSAEAMALAWSHQPGAVHGAALVVDDEIGAYNRLREPWRHPQAGTLTAAVIMRPPLDLSAKDAIWLAGGLGLLGALRKLYQSPLALRWPDEIFIEESGVVIGQLRVLVEEERYRIRGVVMTFRLRLPDDQRLDRGSLLQTLLSEVDARVDLLGQGRKCLETQAREYNRWYPIAGSRARVVIRGKHDMRGTVMGVSWDGALGLRSNSGLVEKLTVESVLSIIGL